MSVQQQVNKKVQKVVLEEQGGITGTWLVRFDANLATEGKSFIHPMTLTVLALPEVGGPCPSRGI
jgi:hypothetical protein